MGSTLKPHEHRYEGAGGTAGIGDVPSLGAGALATGVAIVTACAEAVTATCVVDWVGVVAVGVWPLAVSEIQHVARRTPVVDTTRRVKSDDTLKLPIACTTYIL